MAKPKANSEGYHRDTRRSANIKLVVYMPRQLHRQLRLHLATIDQGNKSAFICDLVEKAVTANGTHDAAN